jgi:osmoprotectant transport system permease protein
MNKKIFVILYPLFFCLNGFCSSPIIIGSKKFTESIILGEVLSIILEKKYNKQVIRKFGLGGTKIAFDALVNNDIHTYPEYTGTGYVMILKLDGEKDPSKVFQIVSSLFQEKWDINWSKSVGFNNTYALAVRKGNNKFKFIKKISELSGNMGSIKYAAPYEFMERKDGHAPFSNFYNLNFSKENITSMEAGLMYSAIIDQEVDMIIVYSTDGRIKTSNLKLLEDDKQFFPPYYVSYIYQNKTAKDHPPLQKAINLMEGLISQEEMVAMNDLVDRLKNDPYSVANNFLINKKIIDGDLTSNNVNNNFFTYAYTKRQYLLKLLLEHLSISFSALLLGCIISLPLGIILTRYVSLSKIVFPIVNIIQTIPSIALLGFLIPIFGIGFYPAMTTLFLYSLLPLIRNTYSGILSIDKDYIEAAKGLGLTNFQILTKVEIPLALPIIIAGIRTATVIIVGTATLAALIGAGGFGDPIFRGVATVNSKLILIGAIPAALLAIFADKIIGYIERVLVSKGVRSNAS